jgi:signal transduction histidine kinase
MDAPEYISRGENILYEIYKAMGNEKMALHFHEKYKLHEDSLGRERFQRTYAEYDIVKKEATIQILENDKLKEKSKRNNLIRNILLLSLFTGIAFSIYVYRNNNTLKNKNAELSQKNIEIEKALQKGRILERKSVAASLHDSLGVQANAIMYNTELLKNELNRDNQRVDILYNSAKEMLLTLRETLWAMKNYEIEAMDIWLRIVNFCHQMSRHHKNTIVIAEGEPPKNKIYEAPKALNLVMIVHEAVNNAIKHSTASKIVVQSHFDDKAWNIAITDNRKEFDELTAQLNFESLGFENMKERAFESGVELKIYGNNNEGCRVQLLIKG